MTVLTAESWIAARTVVPGHDNQLTMRSEMIVLVSLTANQDLGFF